jgi:glucokinase
MSEMRMIGLDVSKGKLIGVLADGNGRVLHQVQGETPSFSSPDDLPRVLADMVGSLAAGSDERPAAVTVGIAAWVDQTRGHVICGPNLGLADYPLRDRLAEVSGFPVFVDNDVNCAILGEAAFGAAQGMRHVVGLIVGTGIGSGIISEGRLIRGARGVGAEAGHMIFIPGGRQCGCGRRGCFEAYAGGRSIEGMVDEARQAHPESMLCQVPGKSLSAVWKCMTGGDAIARGIWDQAVLALRVLVTNMVTLFDPEVVLLGGRVIAELPQVADGIQEFLVSHRMRGVLHSIRLEKPRLGETAVALGATRLAGQGGE